MMIELSVDGMTCGGCAARVTRVIAGLDAGAQVNVDLAAKRVRVESALAPQTLAQAVTDAGYPAKPVDGGAAAH
jgi:copper chaperone CopZ